MVFLQISEPVQGLELGQREPAIPRPLALGLRLPESVGIPVPSAFARTSAPPAIAPYLNAYPQPDDRTVIPGVFTARFTGSWSNAATLNAGSVRIDHTFNSRWSVFARYN